jgi:hypothetical protein
MVSKGPEETTFKNGALQEKNEAAWSISGFPLIYQSQNTKKAI